MEEVNKKLKKKTDIEAKQAQKLEMEVRLTEAKAEKAEFDLKVAQGEYVPKTDLEGKSKDDPLVTSQAQNVVLREGIEEKQKIIDTMRQDLNSEKQEVGRLRSRNGSLEDKLFVSQVVKEELEKAFAMEQHKVKVLLSGTGALIKALEGYPEIQLPVEIEVAVVHMTQVIASMRGKRRPPRSDKHLSPDMRKMLGNIMADDKRLSYS